MRSLARRSLPLRRTRKTSEAPAQRILDEAKLLEAVREKSRKEAEEQPIVELEQAIEASKAEAEACRLAADKAALK